MDHQPDEKSPASKDESTALKTTEKSQAATTSTGLDENVAGLLCYLVGIITGVIFILLEKENRFIRFHALQSIFTFVFLFIANMLLTALPVIGWGIGLILAPLSLLLWIVLMVKAYQRKWFKLPIVGDMAEKQVTK